MNTHGLVGMTLCIVGLLFSVTCVGLFAAPLFFLPGLPLCHMEFHRHRARRGTIPPELVVVMTLSYVALAASIVMICLWILQGR